MAFVNRARTYFEFLESEYKFNILAMNNSEIRPETDGMVKYQSSTTIILIDSETGYVTIRFARVIDGEKYYITPIDIHEYLNTTEEEKKLLLSTNPSNQTAASALFNKKFLLNQSDWKDSRGSVEDLEKGLLNFSNWVRKNAKLCLEDNFLNWLMFYEYKIQRARADHLRRGKDELGYARVQDANGKWGLIKQSIFKDKLEYIDRLKNTLK
jgi:hypothetical protein